MTEPKEQLAIIQQAERRVEDHSGNVCLCFSAYITECGAALQVIEVADPRFLGLWQAMGDTIDSLNGKPCWVDVSRPGLITFLRMWGEDRAASAAANSTR